MSDERVLWLQTQFAHRKGSTRATSHRPSGDRAVIWKPEVQNTQNGSQNHKDSDIQGGSARFGTSRSRVWKKVHWKNNLVFKN